MIKSDCKLSKVIIQWKLPEEQLRPPAPRKGRGGLSQSGLGAYPARTKVPCGGVPCVQPTFTPCGGVYVRTRDPKEASLKTPMDLP